jgi:hypothetical protein
VPLVVVLTFILYSIILALAPPVALVLINHIPIQTFSYSAEKITHDAQYESQGKQGRQETRHAVSYLSLCQLVNVVVQGTKRVLELGKKRWCSGTQDWCCGKAGGVDHALFTANQLLPS